MGATAGPLRPGECNPAAPAARGPHPLDPRVAELEVTGMKLGLDTIRHVLDALDHPERAFPSVLVAGTNGKGSTANLLAALAEASGARVGLFTSPHLSRLNERFRIGTEEIGDADLMRLADVLWGLRERDPRAAPLTFFEFCTALAVSWFRERAVDLAVLEVGLGGRLDSTNACEPALSVVGTIGLDHTAWLGDTVGQIAWEKAGIVRAGGECVTHASGEGGDALERIVSDRGARLERLGREYDAVGTPAGFRYRSAGGTKDGLVLGLAGRHQVRNAALALRAWERLVDRGILPGAADEAIAAALAGTRVPGRLERFPGSPEVWVDGAHNPEGAGVLADALADLPRRRPCLLVFGAAGDKASGEMLAALLPSFDAAVMTAARARRAEEPDVLLARARERLPAVRAESVRGAGPALDRARQLARPSGRVVVAGSLFLVGEVRDVLLSSGIRPG